MNPIWKREFIARWRDGRSHLLLLALVVLLSASAYWNYNSALQYSPINYNVFPARPVTESIITRASRTGHTLFLTLAMGNVLTWFLLAPLLTATGVARERENGLLESIQLSRMSPLSQIIARTLSALSYLAALQLVTMPIYFVAFSFGGVSQEEILRVWEVVAATAFCGVGLGLALSAQSTRPSSALFAVVALLVGWSLLAFVGGNLGVWVWFLGVGPWSATISEVLLYSHPLTIAWGICEPKSSSLFGVLSIWVSGAAENTLPLAVKGWLLVGFLGLLKATRDVTRALPPVGWAQRNVWVQRWKNNREERLKKQQASWRNKVSVEGALLADLPFDRLIRFKNPLLNREVKGRFRLRRASPWVWLGRFTVFLAGAGIWVMVFFSAFFDPTGRASSVPIVLWGEWLLGSALIATFASSSFAREREAGTWEGVQLSLFSPGEIMRSKWAAPLLAFAIMSSPLWMLLFVLLPWGSWNGVPLPWMLLGASVVIASLCWISALGSWISLRAKSTASATCWTIGVLLGLFVGVVLVENTLDIPGRIAAWHYGMSDYDTSGSPFVSYTLYNRPQYKALYAKETGLQAQQPRGMGTAREWNEWNNYIRWFEERRAAMYRFQNTLNFWNPLVVIAQLQGRSVIRVSGDFDDTQSLHDQMVVTMSLLHIALAGVGTFGLLLGVKKQLQNQIE